MADTTADYECPVCSEDFKNPKLLDCNHLVCRDCILTWLKKSGGQGACPLCRAPVVFPCEELTTAVDSLPTDLATLALVSSHQILTGPHVCATCQNNVPAASYCFECETKLCPTCVRYHKRFPALQEHTLERLKTLTPGKLAAKRRTVCPRHAKRAGELYCAVHEELLCTLCAATDHRGCEEVKVVSDMASLKREELKQHAVRLKDKEVFLVKQVEGVKDKFKVMQSKAKDVYDDLEKTLNEQRQKTTTLIQAKQREAMTSLADVEKVRASITSHARTIDHVVTSAPDDALLQMMKQLTSRLSDVETQSAAKCRQSRRVGDIAFDTSLLVKLKSDLNLLGQGTHFIPPKTQPVKDLTEGDRVMRGPDWHSSNKDIDKGRPGTVTAVPSKMAARDGVNPVGLVDVRWDTGEEHYYCMGQEDLYELDLA